MRTLVLALLVLTGCSLPANPQTRFEYGPAKFFDSKDNDVQIKGLTIDPQTGTYHLDELTIRNNASDPRRANVEQIQAYTEQVKAMGAMVQSLGNMVGSMIPYFRPATSVNVDTPYGGGTMTSTPILPTTQPTGR